MSLVDFLTFAKNATTVSGIMISIEVSLFIAGSVDIGNTNNIMYQQMLSPYYI